MPDNHAHDDRNLLILTGVLGLVVADALIGSRKSVRKKFIARSRKALDQAVNDFTRVHNRDSEKERCETPESGSSPRRRRTYRVTDFKAKKKEWSDKKGGVASTWKVYETEIEPESGSSDAARANERNLS